MTAPSHPPPIDTGFLRLAVEAADAAVDRLLAPGGAAPVEAAPLGPHRESMRRTKLLVAAFLAPGGRHTGEEAVSSIALDAVDALAAMQLPSGLFAGGDNVESPPDSGFTINDVCDVLELLRRAAPDDGRLEPMRARLDRIAAEAVPALLAGGVHTPNHRWELSAALARLHRHRPDAAVRRRIDEWLAEGVDIDADGSYSERSANYAAFVSNPSLLAIADIVGRSDLFDAVTRNLESTLDLIRPDRSVETVHSRRQDQRSDRFPLAHYLLPYRRLAIELGRRDFAWAAEEALRGGILEPQTLLAELLLDPRLGAPLPPAVAPEAVRRRAWPASGLLVDIRPEREVVVYGGSDHARLGRIQSGLANNPTFLRLFAGDAVLRSVRLSRAFFGLGPFRASEHEILPDRVVLRERVAAQYYHPLPPGRRREDGAYPLVDEGRFAACMDFDARPADTVELRTTIEVRLRADGVELELHIEGPSLTWALELAFRPGGRFEGLPDADRTGTRRLDDGSARYRIGGRAIEFGPGTGAANSVAVRYSPGEEYTQLGGTDALDGPRVLLGGRAPGRHRLVIRVV